MGNFNIVCNLYAQHNRLSCILNRIDFSVDTRTFKGMIIISLDLRKTLFTEMDHVSTNKGGLLNRKFANTQEF